MALNVILFISQDLRFATQHSSIMEYTHGKRTPTYKVRKTKISSESTSNKPCVKEFPTICRENQLNDLIAETSNCKIPYFNSKNSRLAFVMYLLHASFVEYSTHCK